MLKNSFDNIEYIIKEYIKNNRIIFFIITCTAISSIGSCIIGGIIGNIIIGSKLGIVIFGIFGFIIGIFIGIYLSSIVNNFGNMIGIFTAIILIIITGAIIGNVLYGGGLGRKIGGLFGAIIASFIGRQIGDIFGIVINKLIDRYIKKHPFIFFIFIIFLAVIVVLTIQSDFNIAFKLYISLSPIILFLLFYPDSYRSSNGKDNSPVDSYAPIEDEAEGLSFNDYICMAKRNERNKEYINNRSCKDIVDESNKNPYNKNHIQALVNSFLIENGNLFSDYPHNFTGGRFLGIDFIAPKIIINMQNWEFKDSIFEDCNFKNIWFENISFIDSKIKNTYFHNIQINGNLISQNTECESVYYKNTLINSIKELKK
ncbi:MAG: hypothetical protein LBH40_06080 [Alphaproteobacteria bacterium]|jgi:hypothetical protein|nr:hypothetical protein [Alphaproteobacteria bacterium]